MRESRSSGSVEGVMGNHDSYSDSDAQLLGNSRQRCDMGSSLGALDHREIGDADRSPLREFFLRQLERPSQSTDAFTEGTAKDYGVVGPAILQRVATCLDFHRSLPALARKIS